MSVMKNSCVIFLIVAVSTYVVVPASTGDRGFVFGRWPDLDMTYAYDQSCQLPYRHAAIDIGLQAWQRWLPESTWSETSLDSARLRLLCFDSNSILGAPGVAATVITYPKGSFDATSWLYTFLYANVEFANNTWSFGDLTETVAAHELGHAFGLIDGTGGLMNQNDWRTVPYDSSLGIPVPTQQQMDALSEVYGLPMHMLSAVTRTTQTIEVSVTTTETTVTTTPEFPMPMLVLLVLASAIVILKIRKTSATVA